MKFKSLQVSESMNVLFPCSSYHTWQVPFCGQAGDHRIEFYVYDTEFADKEKYRAPELNVVYISKK